jgi:hypothetical protein
MSPGVSDLLSQFDAVRLRGRRWFFRPNPTCSTRVREKPPSVKPGMNRGCASGVNTLLAKADSFFPATHPAAGLGSERARSKRDQRTAQNIALGR